ncbi:DUF2730 domain-containing protein [Pasteurella multocida subsp. multocida]|uniref:DUF2730 domain-containing protein n=1 Tax=Pasteurella multocida TaxID=747 RepID=A0A9X3ZM65_PASMD|nr:DUF2730 family protein [Pasteurella multocida]MBF6981562.1 DUF2730 family protein [Pasteurella multocida]MBF6985953.1 DUF2730 family protein [Pasteurella multocida]MDA5607604.1 DUF2730 domain-containing protein [Pasteurella multocida subsp. multocida]MDA5611563.1 DUF2730 domain-containing protein [Pasteurella multocida]MDA5614009.1 DUF2730 domain-containing protein [Pasteurella multocida]
MMEILEIIKQHWGIILTIAGLLASVFWLKMDSRYAKKTAINDLEQRVTEIESEVKHLPSAKDVTELRVALVEMKGEAKELRTETKMLRHLVALLTEKEVKK